MSVEIGMSRRGARCLRLFGLQRFVKNLCVMLKLMHVHGLLLSKRSEFKSVRGVLAI